MMPDDASVAAAPGLTLVGYGPSASTIGAARAGREAAGAALEPATDPARPTSATVHPVIH
jgi:hypothetical protein